MVDKNRIVEQKQKILITAEHYILFLLLFKVRAIRIRKKDVPFY